MNNLHRVALSSLILVLAAGCGRRSSDGGGGGEGGGGANSGGDTGSEGEGEGEGAGEGEGEAPTLKSVEALQNPDAEGAAKSGDTVVVEGVVTAGPDSDGSFHIGDPAGGRWSGVYVFNRRGSRHVDTSAVTRGSSVRVEGDVVEYPPEGDDQGGALTEITVDKVTVLGQGTLPEPTPVTAAEIADNASGEPWEGVLVEISDDPIQVTAAGLEHRQFQVNAGLFVGAEYFHFAAAPDQQLTHLRGVVSYGFGYFRLSPRDAQDVGGEPPPTPTVTTRQLQDPAQEQPAERSSVRLEGVVVTAGPNEDNTALFVQSGSGEYSGVYVYNNRGTVSLQGVEQGVIVNLEGEFQEFTFDEGQPGTVTEIYLRSIEVVDTGEVPAPSVVPIADLAGDKAEPWEGVLIEVQDVAVTAVDAEHGEFTIGATIDVADEFFAAQVQEGMQLSRIAGPLHFANGAYKLLPRSAEDLAE